LPPSLSYALAPPFVSSPPRVDSRALTLTQVPPLDRRPTLHHSLPHCLVRLALACTPARPASVLRRTSARIFAPELLTLPQIASSALALTPSTPHPREAAPKLAPRCTARARPPHLAIGPRNRIASYRITSPALAQGARILASHHNTSTPLAMPTQHQFQPQHQQHQHQQQPRLRALRCSLNPNTASAPATSMPAQH